MLHNCFKDNDIFWHGFLKDNTIGIISQTGISGHRNRSQEGFYYPSLHHTLSIMGEKVLLKSPVDSFHGGTNTVFQYHGYYFHGCKQCYKDRTAKNTFNGQTFDALTLHQNCLINTTTKRILAIMFLKSGSVNLLIKNVNVQNVSTWNQRHLNWYLKMFFGSRTEAINLQTTITEDVQNGKEILYSDVISICQFTERVSSWPSEDYFETSAASNK